MEGGRALLAALLLALTYVPASQAQVAVVDSAPALGRRLAAGDGSGGAAATGARCPPLSKELLQRRAKNNTVMLAVMNVAQWDFGRNWLHHIKAAGIDYYAVAATDAEVSAKLAEAGEPCFERIDEEAQKLGLEWGQEGWRRMTLGKVFMMEAVVEYGFNHVVSDVDVVWFRDPLELFDRHPDAAMLFSEDGTQSRNAPGDDGLERSANPHYNFNTGVALVRAGPNTTLFYHEFARFVTSECKSHEQPCAYELMRTKDMHREEGAEEGLWRTWHDRLTMGIIPSSMFMNGHTLYLQHLDQVKGVKPYAVHATWTYGNMGGKRSRLQDLGLWQADPPEAYDGTYVTVDLHGVPAPPADYNAWNENEDMIALHLRAIHLQLQQTYVGMALSLAAQRAFILPQLTCFCEKIWYGVVRCRVVDAQNITLPFPCPQDYVFNPGEYASRPDPSMPVLDVREAGFLGRERTAAEVKSQQLIIRPSAALQCTDCVKEVAPDAASGHPVLLVPPGLTDAQLLPLLAPFKKYRVWRLSFEGVGAVQRAYGGFASEAAAHQFDQRMERITTTFCCRREDEAPRYHHQKEISVKLRMYPEFNYTAMAAARRGTQPAAIA